MGEAKRRKQLDPNYGKPVAVSAANLPSRIAVNLKKSNVTGRWLTMTSINGSESSCISCWKKLEEGRQASQQIAEAFGKIPPVKWALPESFNEAIKALPFEDDDEVLGVGYLMPNTRL